MVKIKSIICFEEQGFFNETTSITLGKYLLIIKEKALLTHSYLLKYSFKKNKNNSINKSMMIRDLLNENKGLKHFFY